MNKHFLLALPFYIHLVILISAFMLNLYAYMFLPQYLYLFDGFDWGTFALVTLLWSFLAILHIADKLSEGL